jgi:hypothetical protein
MSKDTIQQITEIPQEVIDKICKTFRVESFFGHSRQIDSNGEPNEEIKIEYIWAAQVKSYDAGYFVLSGLQYKYYKRAYSPQALLSISPSHEEAKYYDVITLEKDPVKDALEQTTLLHLGRQIASEDNAHFNLYCAGTHSSTQISCWWGTEFQSISLLWQAILSVRNELRKKYNKPEIEKYFERYDYPGLRE